MTKVIKSHKDTWAFQTKCTFWFFTLNNKIYWYFVKCTDNQSSYTDSNCSCPSICLSNKGLLLQLPFHARILTQITVFNTLNQMSFHLVETAGKLICYVQTVSQNLIIKKTYLKSNPVMGDHLVFSVSLRKGQRKEYSNMAKLLRKI